MIEKKVLLLAIFLFLSVSASIIDTKSAKGKVDTTPSKSSVTTTANSASSLKSQSSSQNSFSFDSKNEGSKVYKSKDEPVVISAFQPMTLKSAATADPIMTAS